MAGMSFAKAAGGSMDSGGLRYWGRWKYDLLAGWQTSMNEDRHLDGTAREPAAPHPR